MKKDFSFIGDIINAIHFSTKEKAILTLYITFQDLG